MRPFHDQTGSMIPAYVAGVATALVLFVMLVEIVVWQYGRGVVRAALDEGARAGAPASSDWRTCENRAGDALSDLLGGRLGQDVHVTCAEEGDEMVAHAQATFRSWLAPSPDWTFSVTAAAVKERLP